MFNECVGLTSGVCETKTVGMKPHERTLPMMVDLTMHLGNCTRHRKWSMQKKYEKCNYVAAILLEEFNLYNHVLFGGIHLACNL